jgi:peptide/nickel transport system substrate-binding protein
MSVSRQRALFWCLVALLAAACAGPQSSTPSGGRSSADSPPPSGPTRITAAIKGEATSLSRNLNSFGGGTVQGTSELERLVHVGLTIQDDHGNRHPRLAEAVPSVANGRWQVRPDGRMETTWTIRNTAVWHDGIPVTAEDLVFTATVGRDRDLPLFRDLAYESVEGIEARDARTIVVRWSKPFIWADALFQGEGSMPLPRHLLERAYHEQKEAFAQLPYWRTEFIGTGPYKLREFVAGSHVLLDANEQYVLGRPRIDEIQVKFIPDANIIAVNLLARAIDLTLGTTISLEQALQVREQGARGQMEVTGGNQVIGVFPQLINPSPAVVADVRFRRALLHAIDRQQLSDSIQAGLSSVAHFYGNPESPDYRPYDIQGSIVRYDFDVRRGAQMIGALGYATGADGAFRDASGERLSLQLYATVEDEAKEKAALAVTDTWQRFGVGVEYAPIPIQRNRDREYRATFPAFFLQRQPGEVDRLQRFHSREAPLPENSFIGESKNRYMNPEFDSLLDRLFVTIPLAERTQILRQIVHQMTDEVLVLGLFYNVVPTMMIDQLQRVTAETTAWNAHEWELR